MAKPVAINEKNFEEVVLKASQPVLVDFWAEWCGPCRMIAPIVDELAQEYEGKISFTKLNVDQDAKVATRYGIMSIPTLLIFKGGKPVDQIVGFQPKKELKKRLEAQLAAGK